MGLFRKKAVGVNGRQSHPDVNDERDPNARCERCGHRASDPFPSLEPFDVEIECQGCGDLIVIPEASFIVGGGMHVKCGRCDTGTEVPTTIWCPQCGQHLRYGELGALIREANRRR